MSAGTAEVWITPKDLGSIPRKVAAVICQLVNRHGVTYRMQAGDGHVYLYNGDRKTRPFKISAHRPEEASLNFLDGWIRENCPAYYEEPVKQADVAALAEALNTEPVRPKVVSTNEKVDLVGRRPHVHGNGNDSGFDTDGETYYCRKCPYTQSHPRGMHLHKMSHEDPEALRAMQQEAAQKRVLNREQNDILIREAFKVLAKELGYQVVDAGVDLKRLLKYEEEVATLRAERDDLKARLDLMREALKA